MGNVDIFEFAVADRAQRLFFKWLGRVVAVSLVVLLTVAINRDDKHRTLNLPEKLAIFHASMLPLNNGMDLVDALGIPVEGYQIKAGTKSITVTRADLVCAARAIYYDTRGKPVTFQTAVAEVIVNRVRSARYPNTVCKVVYQGIASADGCFFHNTCKNIGQHPGELVVWRKALRVANDTVAAANAPFRNARTAVYFAPEGDVGGPGDAQPFSAISGYNFFAAKPKRRLRVTSAHDNATLRPRIRSQRRSRPRVTTKPRRRPSRTTAANRSWRDVIFR